MNLHGIASGVIAAVNPMVPVTLRVSTGYTKGTDYTQQPSYAPDVIVPAQVQALSAGELRQVDSLNLSGEKRGVYFYGTVDGLVRANKKGGDIVILPDGSEWLVVMVFEYWPDWTKVAICLQRTPPFPRPPGDQPSLDFSNTTDPDNSMYIPGIL